MARELGRTEQPRPTGLKRAYRAGVRQAPRLDTPADPGELAAALAFALLFDGRKRLNLADEVIAKIAARRQVEHLERAGFVVMKRPPTAGRRRGREPSSATGKGIRD